MLYKDVSEIKRDIFNILDPLVAQRHNLERVQWKEIEMMKYIQGLTDSGRLATCRPRACVELCVCCSSL